MQHRLGSSTVVIHVTPDVMGLLQVQYFGVGMEFLNRDGNFGLFRLFRYSCRVAAPASSFGTNRVVCQSEADGGQQSKKRRRKEQQELGDQPLAVDKAA
eukprot:1221773-Amphidinium_carterae.1